MNYEQILDSNTPFNDQKLSSLDQIVTIFYTTKNNTEVIPQIRIYFFYKSYFLQKKFFYL